MSQQHDIIEEEFTGRIDLRMWWKFLKRARPYKANLVALGAVGVGAAIGDASFGLLTKFVIDEAIAGGPYLWHWVGAYLGAVLLLCTCVWFFIYNAGKVSRYLSHDIRTEAFSKLQDLSFAYYDRKPVGWIMSRLTGDCDRLAQIIAWGLLDMFWGVLVLILMAGVMLALNWKLALIVLAVVPPLVLVSKWFQRRILLASRRIRKTNSLLTASYNEQLMGVRTTKTLVRERENLAEFQNLSGRMYEQSMRNAILTAVYLPVVMTMGAAAAGAVLWQGGGQAVAGAMSLGTLVAFVSYAGQFFAPIRELAATITNMQGAQSSGERVMGLLETEPAIKDSDDVLARLEQCAHKPDANAADGYPDRIETITFENVSFEYDDGTTVLQGFDLRVEAGQTIALVGPTGGGKSTIVNLVCRFYEPTDGRLLINGIDYRQRSLLWLQSNLGIVLQAPAPVQRDGARKHPVRPTDRDRRGGRARRAARAGVRLHHGHGRRLRDRGRRGRQPTLDRAEAVGLVRAGDFGRPAGVRHGRGDQLDRHDDGARDPAGLVGHDGRTDQLHHRAPAVHDPLSRPDPVHRGWHGHRRGHARRPDRATGQILQALHKPHADGSDGRVVPLPVMREGVHDGEIRVVTNL